MALKAGTLADFSGSMAEAIENALEREWPNVMGAGSSFATNPQLKLLCIAVAQGVVRYLADHDDDAFSVGVDIAGVGTAIGTVTITTTGTLY